jgi:hypothetical protein
MRTSKLWLLLVLLTLAAVVAPPALARWTAVFQPGPARVNPVECGLLTSTDWLTVTRPARGPEPDDSRYAIRRLNHHIGHLLKIRIIPVSGTTQSVGYQYGIEGLTDQPRRFINLIGMVTRREPNGFRRLTIYFKAGADVPLNKIHLKLFEQGGPLRQRHVLFSEMEVKGVPGEWRAATVTNTSLGSWGTNNRVNRFVVYMEGVNSPKTMTLGRSHITHSNNLNPETVWTETKSVGCSAL